jgi:hypothetical protein
MCAVAGVLCIVPRGNLRFLNVAAMEQLGTGSNNPSQKCKRARYQPLWTLYPIPGAFRPLVSRTRSPTLRFSSSGLSFFFFFFFSDTHLLRNTVHPTTVHAGSRYFRALDAYEVYSPRPLEQRLGRALSRLPYSCYDTNFRNLLRFISPCSALLQLTFALTDHLIRSLTPVHIFPC